MKLHVFRDTFSEKIHFEVLHFGVGYIDPLDPKEIRASLLTISKMYKSQRLPANFDFHGQSMCRKQIFEPFL